MNFIFVSRAENKNLLIKTIEQFLSWQIAAVEKTILAVPKKGLDRNISSYCKKRGLLLHAGQDSDPVGRLIACYDSFNLDSAVRLTDSSLTMTKGLLTGIIRSHAKSAKAATLSAPCALFRPLEILDKRTIEKIRNSGQRKNAFNLRKILNADKVETNRYEYPLPDGSRIPAFMEKYRPFPPKLIIEPTNACNLKCPVCPRKYMTTDVGFMEFSLFRKIIDEAVSNGVNEATLFFRGEPFMHPDFPSMLEYSKKRNVPFVEFSTNGALLDKTVIERICKTGTDKITFSVDSIDEKTYHRIRKGADFNTVMNNINATLKRREPRKTKVAVSMVSMNDKRAENDFVRFWKGKSDEVKIYSRHSPDGKFGRLFYRRTAVREKKPCGFPFSEMTVYWNGNIALCCQDWNRKEAIGNAKNKSIREIWNSSKYNRIRTLHINGLLDKVFPCEVCDNWKVFYPDRNPTDTNPTDLLRPPDLCPPDLLGPPDAVSFAKVYI